MKNSSINNKYMFFILGLILFTNQARTEGAFQKICWVLQLMTTTCIMFSFEENRYTGIYILILIKYEQNLKVPDEIQEL